MKTIIIDINHPAHVHVLKNVYKSLIARGHKVFVTVRQIPAALKLLEIYGIPYIYLGDKKNSLLGKALEQFIYDFKVLRLVRKEHIQIGIGTSVSIPHVSKLTRMKSILLDDDDDAVEPLFVKYVHPFADTILSPEGTPRALASSRLCVRNKSKRPCVRKKPKLQYVPSYHELAYLHPNHFTPDPKVLQEAGIQAEEKYFILRFNAFKAHHDVGVVGLTIENKRCLVQMLSQYGKVFITTERNIDDEFLPYQLKLSPEKAHSLLAGATMFIGDSQTMTSEAAVLGVPAIRCNTFVGRIHYLEEEEHRYGLTYGFLPENAEAMFVKIEELLAMPNLHEEWQRRRQIMLHDKIDYAQYLTDFIEHYPIK